MAKSTPGKKTFLQKAKSLTRKFAAVAAIGAAGYGTYAYQYETQEDVVAKVIATDIKTKEVEIADGKKKEEITGYVVTTDQGDLHIKPTRFFGMNNKDAAKFFGAVEKGKTYTFHVSGKDAPLLHRKVVKLPVEVTAQPEAPAAETTAAAEAATPALSGALKTIDVVSADRQYVIQMTVPAEAAGRITVNGVSALAPRAPTPAP